MIRLFLAVFGGAFICIVAASAIMPSLVLGAYQEEFVQAWTDAGVDTSSCDGSVPKLGIGVHECYQGSMKDLIGKIDQAGADGDEGHSGFDE